MIDKWVKLIPSTIDRVWTSHTVHVIMAQNLTCPIILGWPFLKENQITIDHDVLSCISKHNSYDLLSPPKSKINKLANNVRTEPRSNKKDTKVTSEYTKHKKCVVTELVQQMSMKRHKLDSDTQTEHLKNIIAAIRHKYRSLPTQSNWKD